MCLRIGNFLTTFNLRFEGFEVKGANRWCLILVLMYALSYEEAASAQQQALNSLV